MPLQSFQDQKSFDVTTTLSAGSTGNPKTSSAFVDKDGSTNIDGLLLPVISDWIRDRELTLNTQAVSAATQISGGCWHLTVPSHGLSRATQIVLTDGSDNKLAIVSIRKVIDSDTIEINVPNTTEFGAVGTTVADTTNIHSGTTRYSGRLTFGLGFFNLDTQTPASGETVRLAIVVTKDPDSGESFSDRLSNGEVFWSRVYPVGTQVSIDWSGLIIDTGYIQPVPTYPDVTIQNDEEYRVMLVTYSESGSAQTLNISYQLTLQNRVTVDKDRG